MSTSKVIEYINDKLHRRCQPIVFTDLMNNFHIGSSDAKQTMYNYYKETTTMKFNCIIMICYKDGTIKMATDLNETETQSSKDILDCFIYAFNPNKEFIPVYELNDQSGSNLIVNPYKLVIENEKKVESIGSPIKRSQTDSKVSNVKKDIVFNPVRSKTDSAVNSKSNSSDKNTSKKNEPAKPKKSIGLKSTEILAKMRKARDEKEAERQRQLKQRKQEEEANKLRRLNNDPTRKAQMEDLNKLFVDSDEDDAAGVDMNDNKNTNESNKKSEGEDSDVATTTTSIIKMNKTIDGSKLESLPDITAEDSSLEIEGDEPSNNKRNNETVDPRSRIESINPSETLEAENKEQAKKEPLGEESIEEIVTSYVDEDGYIVTNRKRPQPISINSDNSKRNIGQSSSPKKVTSRAKSILANFGNASKKSSLPPRKKVKQGSIESFFKKS